MNFDWTAQQQDFRHRVAVFARQHLADDVRDRDANGRFSQSLWNRCAEFGIQGMHVPTELGGRDSADLLMAVAAMEVLGRECRDAGLLLALNAHMWSVQLPLLKLASESQQREYLPRLCSGEWKGAHAMTEPQAGSDAFGLQTTATETADGFRLNGTKCMVTLAPLADVFLVTATVDPAKGQWGLCTFIVPRTAAGLDVGPAESKMGLRTVPFGSLVLRDCRVPRTARLGQGGEMAALHRLLEVERCCILACQVGAMERQLDDSVRYVRERRQFGRSIGSFQSVSNRIADMKMRLEASRWLLYRVAWLKSRDRSAMAETALLKLFLSESFVDSSLDAVRVHGGRGYMTEFEVERDLRDALGGVFYAGTSDIQRNIIASMLGVA